MRTPPKVVSVADGVWSIRTTSTSMTVNAFVVRSGGDVALVDTGFPAKAADTVDALAELGLRPGDIGTVLYTHSHPDHMGGGVALAEQLVGRHVFWEGTKPATGNFHAYYAGLQRWDAWLADVLSPGSLRDTLVSVFSGPPPEPIGSGEIPRRTPVAFGDEIRVGEFRFVCVDARGHDPFHAGWYEPDKRWLFSGDVVLRNPTPMLPVLRDDLPAYRQTLSRLARTLEVDVLFPGHGRERTDFRAAVDASAGHVAALYRDVAAALASGPIDVNSLVPELGPASPAGIRRAFITVGGVASQLAELEAAGIARRRGERHWEAVVAPPSYDAFVGG